MLFRRFSERFRQHSWFGVAVDLIVVVAGILLALQLDAWAESRAERRLEAVYLHRLVEDLDIERTRMEAADRFARSRIEASRHLERLINNPDLAATDPNRVAWAIETATWRSFPQINAFVYRELQSTGRFVLIRSEVLRRSLAEHYTTLQHDARVGEDLTAQQRFDAATAGLLTIDELEAVERAAGDFREISVTPTRAVALARGLRSRPAAVAELASLVQHHTFNLRVINQMRLRADSIIERIDSIISKSHTTR